MNYTLDTWLTTAVLPYPTLSINMGNVILINDIIKTGVPDVVFGCTDTKTPHHIHLLPFLCYLDKDSKIRFDNDKILIELFRIGISDLDAESKGVIANRYQNKFNI